MSILSLKNVVIRKPMIEDTIPLENYFSNFVNIEGVALYLDLQGDEQKEVLILIEICLKELLENEVCKMQNNIMILNRITMSS